MALETPNRQHASFVAFYAEEGVLPPDFDNDEVFIVTASAGILGIAFIGDTGEESFTNGFMVTLQEPVNVRDGLVFRHGLSNSFGLDSLTPTPVALEAGIDAVDAFGASNGNYIEFLPDYNAEFGFCGVSIFELPRIASAETPTFPIVQPVV